MATVLILQSTAAFATEPLPPSSDDAAVGALREQAIVWGGMLHDASDLAGCNPAQKEWLASVQDSVTAEMATEIAQLRQLVSTDRDAFDKYAAQIRPWVFAQNGGQTGCKQ